MYTNVLSNDQNAIIDIPPLNIVTQYLIFVRHFRNIEMVNFKLRVFYAVGHYIKTHTNSQLINIYNINNN